MTYDELRREWLSGCEALTAHTSGSTGSPKTVELPRELVRRSALRTIERFGIDSGSRIHSCISPEFIGGKMAMIRALEAGCRFSFETPTNRPLRDAAGPLTMVSIVPSQLVYILDHLEDMPEVRYYLVGGSPLPGELRRRVEESGLVVYESYGMTETASHIAVRRVLMEPAAFEPLPGIRVSRDHRGCLVIELPGVDEAVVTNDLAQMNTDGSFIIEGRIDNIIITGGRKVNPLELEDKLRSILGTDRFYITSREDTLWGEAIELKIEAGAMPEDLASRLALLEPAWERPKHVTPIERLEYTDSGKLRRL